MFLTLLIAGLHEILYLISHIKMYNCLIEYKKTYENIDHT